MSETMFAIQADNYGEPETLLYRQVARPEPQAGEVLVRVYAAGVNPFDWKLLSGAMQAYVPMTLPYTPGFDIAGVVEAVGPSVSEFSVGQEVFGQTTSGGYAEYAIASVNSLVRKPANLSFEAAASIPVGATTAWQGLFDHGQLQPGQTVLIQGAAGGVGSFAVQFAHAKGATVFGTASGANLELVRSLGADTVIDYLTTPVERVVQDADLVFDLVGGPVTGQSLALVKPGGRLVSIAGRVDPAQAEARQVQFLSFGAQVSAALLATFASMLESGELTALVGSTFPLSEAAQALVQSKSGHGQGRIVLQAANA